MVKLTTPPPDFSLVLPVYNPGQVLESSLSQLAGFLSHEGRGWEVLLVNDGSFDGSSARMDDFALQHPMVRVLHLQTNQGKGKAVRLGLLAATGRFRIFTDIDLAYDFDQILRVAEALRRGHPMVIASRTHPRSQLKHAPQLKRYLKWRELQSRVFTWIVHRLLPIPHTDTQAGLKGMSERAVLDVVPRLQCNGFAFDCELLFLGQQRGWPILEVPVCVQWTSRATTTHWRTTLSMLADLWAMRRRWLREEEAAHRPRAISYSTDAEELSMSWHPAFPTKKRRMAS